MDKGRVAALPSLILSVIFKTLHIMKKLIRREPLTQFIYKTSFKTRTEIQYYSDGTCDIVDVVYYYFES